MCCTSSLNGSSNGTFVPIETRYLLDLARSSSHLRLFLGFPHWGVRACLPVHEVLAEPTHRDRVADGDGCRRRPVGLPYRYAVEQVVAAARYAVVRLADRLAPLLAYRTHEAVVVSLCFIKYTLSLHFAACIRRILE
jgi:hypothetical protein